MSRYPTHSGSNNLKSSDMATTRLAVVVFPTPNVPFIQMITRVKLGRGISVEHADQATVTVCHVSSMA